MATVTGLTAAAMIAIRDQTIVEAEITGGHLILTRYDESTIDAGSIASAVGAATDTTAGVVELATSAETIAGTDSTRAVTPAGLLSLASTKQPIDDDLTAISNISPANDDFIQRKSGVWVNRTLAQVSSDLSATLLPKTGGTMTGAITSNRSATTDVILGGGISGDTFDRVREYADGKREVGPGSGARDVNWYRASSGLWRTDHSVDIVTNLTVGGTAGFTGAFLGASNMNVGAWTSWTPTWTTTSGSATPSLGNATVDCKYVRFGRTIHYRMNIVFGNTTNFGTSPTSSDNWLFSMPVTAAASGVPIGYASYWVGSLTKATAGLAHLNSTTQIILYTGSGSADNSSLAGGIVDSVSPLTWANGDRLSIFGTYEAAA
jgi:hypothetical protein